MKGLAECLQEPFTLTLQEGINMRVKKKSLRAVLTATAVLTTVTVNFANPLYGDAFAASHPKTVITWWTWNPNLSTQDAMIAAFEKQNPSIVVKPTNYTYTQYLVALKTAAAGGQLPDVFGLQVGGMAAQYQQYLLPLNSYARSSWGSNWAQRFIPFGLSSVQLSNPPHDNYYYSLPTSLASTSLWYNKALFAKYKLLLPTTWPLLVSDARVFNEHHIPTHRTNHIRLFLNADQKTGSLNM